MSVQGFIAVDVETANADAASICAIGLVHFQSGAIVRELRILVDPADVFDPLNVGIHGISPETVSSAPTMQTILPTIAPFFRDVIIVHHSPFDRLALNRAAMKFEREPLDCLWLDSARVARRAWPQFSGDGFGLAAMAANLELPLVHHDPVSDAKCAGQLVLRAIEKTGLSLEAWLDRVEEPIAPILRPSEFVAAASGPLSDEIIVFTGQTVMPRQEAQRVAANAGASVAASVTLKTTMLVVGNQDARRLKGEEKSSKHRKAEDLARSGVAIRIVQESDFLRMTAGFR